MEKTGRSERNLWEMCMGVGNSKKRKILTLNRVPSGQVVLQTAQVGVRTMDPKGF